MEWSRQERILIWIKTLCAFSLCTALIVQRVDCTRMLQTWHCITWRGAFQIKPGDTPCWYPFFIQHHSKGTTGLETQQVSMLLFVFLESKKYVFEFKFSSTTHDLCHQLHSYSVCTRKWARSPCLVFSQESLSGFFSGVLVWFFLRSPCLVFS